MRRLSDRLDRDLSGLYADYGVRFEPRWYPIVALLEETGPRAITEMASELGLTHPAVSQVAKSLIEEGLCKKRADKKDGRRHLLSLTPKGKKRIEQLRPLWRAVFQATENLLTDELPGLMAELDALDQSLNEKSMSARVKALLPHEVDA